MMQLQQLLSRSVDHEESGELYRINKFNVCAGKTQTWIEEGREQTVRGRGELRATTTAWNSGVRLRNELHGM
jgi:hypothetical protein